MSDPVKTVVLKLKDKWFFNATRSNSFQRQKDFAYLSAMLKNLFPKEIRALFDEPYENVYQFPYRETIDIPLPDKGGLRNPYETTFEFQFYDNHVNIYAGRMQGLYTKDPLRLDYESDNLTGEIKNAIARYDWENVLREANAQ